LQSFSSETKSELAGIRADAKCCCLAELAGLIHAAGKIRLSTEGVTLILETENGAIARKMVWLFNEVFKLSPEVIVEERKQLGKRHAYHVGIVSDTLVRQILKDVHILDDANHLDGSIAPELTGKECCRWSFLRGAFLGAGSISDPARNYHLEIITENPEFAQGLYYLLSLDHLRVKNSIRKQSYVIYLKECDSIIQLLTLMGANDAVLRIANLLVIKEMRGGVNRLVNAETANLAKAAESGAEQLKLIKEIDECYGINRLPDKLKQFALMRIEHPEVSLKEIGAMMRPPVGKSAMNHRLRRLREILAEHGEKPELDE
jgi:DNA-binding protein WhiA